MNKKFQSTVSSFQALGFLIWVLSSVFRDNLNDFALGFCEGASFILIFMGFIYILMNIRSKKNS